MNKTVCAVLAACVLLSVSGCGTVQTAAQPSARPTASPAVPNALYADYTAKDMPVEDFDQRMDAAVALLEDRLDMLGYPSAAVRREGDTGIRVETPDMDNPVELFTLLAGSARVEFIDPNGQTVLDSDRITDASAAVAGGNYVDNITLNDEGTKQLTEATEHFIGKAMDIHINGIVVSSPVINAPITGGLVCVPGCFTQTAAHVLAAQLKTGPLPLVLKLGGYGKLPPQNQP